MTDPWPDLAQAPSLPIAGADIAYLAQGQGDPVVLAHGALGDLRTLLPVAMTLADAYEAITLSLPALTAADRPDRPFGTDAQVDDFRDIIAHLARGPVHLVAWSYAAHAALALAARYPACVRSVFVFEPGFPTFIADEAIAATVIHDMMGAYEPVAEAFVAGALRDAVRHAIDAAAQEPGYFDRQAPAYRMIHEDNASTLAALFGQSPPTELTAADLGAITCPITIARGALTRPCYSLVTDAAAGLVPGAQHVIVADAGHLLPEQEPQRFAALVRAHLARAAKA